jgi:hypothetical protein
LNEFLEYALGGGGAADITQTNKENMDWHYKAAY